MKPLKIVHCANFSEAKLGSVYYAIDRKVSNGLIRNGHFVYDFSYRHMAKYTRSFNLKKTGISNMNHGLIETCRNIQPHILMLGHSELINNETLQIIRTEHPGIKIAMWWVDWIYNLGKIVDRLQLIDCFFITSNPEALQEITQDSAVLSKCHYFPNMCDSSIDRYKSFENNNYQYDLLFIGRYDEERKKLVDFMKTNLSHLRLGLFGQDKESIVLGTTFFEKIYASKIAVNFNRNNNISKYSSDRIVQLAANGVMVLSAEIPEMTSVFNSNEVAYFKNFDSFKEKVAYYLKNNDKRVELATAGWKKAHKEYDCTTVTNYMVEKCYRSTLSSPPSNPTIKPIIPPAEVIGFKNNSQKEMAHKAFFMVSRYGLDWLFKSNTESYATKQPQGKLTRIHGGDRADVYQFTYDNKSYCLKWFHDRRLSSKLRNGLGFSKAQKSYEISLRLKQKTINTPDVLGIVQKNRFTPPLLVMEMLEGYQQVNLLLEEWKKTTPELQDLGKFKTLATDFAKFCLNLETNHVLHHDFSPRNVLVAEKKGVFSFYLIDIEDIYFGNKSAEIIHHFKGRLPRYLSKTECSVFLDHFYKAFTTSRP